MRVFVLRGGALFILFISSIPGAARAGAVEGVVRDAGTLAPVEGVVITALADSGHAPMVVRSRGDGRFSLASLPASRYMLVLTRIGYERTRFGPIVFSAGRPTADLTLDLTPSLIRVNPVVVTASRRLEKALDAPASVSVVSARSIRERPGVTVADYVRTLPGIDVQSKGMNQDNIVARGFGSAQSSALLTMTDYRAASLPSLRYNVPNLIPVTSEDIDRIEIVRGPGAALYGPNCDRGVMHILTRSPFDGPVTSLSLVSGERELTQGTARHATRITDNLAVSLTGVYFRGRDWRFRDPVEQANRDAAIAVGADPETLKIGRRDPILERWNAEGHAEWRVDPRTMSVLSAGFNRSVRNLGLSQIGATQVRNWDLGFVQVRTSRDRFFGQVYVNQSDSHDSYFLRSGSPVIDRSRLWVGQLQNGAALGTRENLTYGVDLQRTDPRTGGTINGRNESSDGVTEAGSYLHSETKLAPRLDLVTAIRGDHHSRFESLVFSPRAALAFHASENQTVRLTFNRAYGTPGSDDLFADLIYSAIPQLPYLIHVEGVPETGFTFERGANGQPFMRSPFTPGALGGPNTYLPLDATQEWPVVKQFLRSTYPVVDSVAAPTASDVSTVLATLSSSGVFDPVTGVNDVPRLRPTITNTLEAGYKGLVGGRVRLAVDVYRSWIHDFIGHLRVITPNVFMDQPTLEAYLVSQGVDPTTATAIAAAASRIPVGTITPRETRDAADLILAVRNFGDVAVWGSDVSILAELSPEWSFGATGSWVSRDQFTVEGGTEPLDLNAPARTGTVTLGYRAMDSGFSGALDFRVTEGYPIYSGVYSGSIASYALVDCRLTYPAPGPGRPTISLIAQNVLDARHREFLGSPEIGRLVLVQWRTEL